VPTPGPASWRPDVEVDWNAWTHDGHGIASSDERYWPPLLDPESQLTQKVPDRQTGPVRMTRRLILRLVGTKLAEASVESSRPGGQPRLDLTAPIRQVGSAHKPNGDTQSGHLGRNLVHISQSTI
jgi:hypothetical protein